MVRVQTIGQEGDSPTLPLFFSLSLSLSAPITASNEDILRDLITPDELFQDSLAEHSD
jgi:hypothetical protein